jgi:predicted TIM-barrel fold metal-dependent hydrolase
MIEPAAAAKASDRASVALVDCDVHTNLPRNWTQELGPYLSPAWRVKLNATGEAYRGTGRPQGYQLPFTTLYPTSRSPLRLDATRGPNGEPPASDPKTLAHELLDTHGIDRATLIPQISMGLGSLPNDDVAAELVSAINHHTSEVWLAADRRFRAYINVSVRDPRQAAREIERWADKPGFVGVYIDLSTIAMGNNHFYPIYEAAEHHGYPIATHITGNVGTFALAPQFAGAPPAYAFDRRASYTHPYQVSVASLIVNGVFERFPRLKVAFVECGYGWLPDLMWRMDAFWKSDREDTPWVKRLPSEYVIDHMRFTTQPFLEPHKHEWLHPMLEMMYADRTLMFATDFPHWDGDAPMHVLRQLPEHMKRRIMCENALDFFGDRLI